MLLSGRMESLIEVVDIGKPNPSNGASSSGTMTGVELLMNDRAKTPTSGGQAGGGSGSIVDVLEKDLNSLAGHPSSASDSGAIAIETETISAKPSLQPVSLSINKEGSGEAPKAPDNAGDKPPSPIKINLGTQSAGAARGNSTWDGYNASSGPPATFGPTISKQDVLREKFSLLRKLETIERKGHRLTKHYTMESSLDEMKGEYEMIVSEKEKEASVKFQAKMLMACVTGITFLNQRFDPFDVNLEGWDETVQENVTDYDDVFAELHEKYRSKAKIAPELKLLFMLGGSAVMAHMSNTMFKSAVPGMDDLLRDNPDLMRQFTAAAANSMSATNPGLAGFVNEFAPGAGGPPRQQPSPFRTTNMGRPDLDIRTAQQNPDNGVTIDNQQAPIVDSAPQSASNRTPRVRPEMVGPRDVGDIVARLKRKEPAADASSRISVEEAVSALSGNGRSARTPNKSKRRTGSEKSVTLNVS